VRKSFFCTFSTDSKSASHFTFYETHIAIKQIFFAHISTANFDVKCAKTAQKAIKFLDECVENLYFSSLSGRGGSI
jgi:hypothetical protein